MKTLFYGVENPDVFLIQPVDSHDMEVMDSEFANIEAHCQKKVRLAAVLVDDWNKDLSPWEAPPVFGKEGFGAGAAETLSYIENNVLSELLGEKDIPIILGGYSLAGLFALWSVYQTDRFAACAAASPSVWFPGWIDYAAEHAPKTKALYLSLGDREKKARNPLMATVADCIVRQNDLLGDLPHTLEWNPGNHFIDSDIRTAKGFVWAIEQIQ
ncbi:MAG: esterase [Lachnospiraceae bacterium]|nr:esterase [Lachnospiraceae bacterium]